MDRQLRGWVAVVLRVAVVVVTVMLVTSVANGWVYWLRAGVAHWPGPKVADVLPLDELPGHDGVPLVVYVAVFVVAGVMLGVMARAVRLDRLTAGLTLAAGTGVWLPLFHAVCFLFVPPVTARAAPP